MGAAVDVFVFGGRESRTITVNVLLWLKNRI
jgi:hypothetical protein